MPDASTPDANPFGSFPRYALGVLSPLAGADTMPYGLYRLLGPDFIVISTSLKLQSFAPADLERAVAAIAGATRHLVSRGADLILQSGTPLALSLGPDGLQRLMARLREHTGLPVLSSALNAVAAAQAVGARRLVVANKWNQSLNQQLVAFLAHWDIAVMGAAAESQEPARFQSDDLRQGAELAYRLGRDALERRRGDALHRRRRLAGNRGRAARSRIRQAGHHPSQRRGPGCLRAGCYACFRPDTGGAGNRLTGTAVNLLNEHRHNSTERIEAERCAIEPFTKLSLYEIGVWASAPPSRSPSVTLLDRPIAHLAHDQLQQFHLFEKLTLVPRP